MIHIQKRKKVKEVKFLSEPDEWKLLKAVKGKIEIPGTFYDGSKWMLEFRCTNCDREVEYKSYYMSPDYILGGKLSYKSFSNKEFLVQIGGLFQLELVDKGIDENGKTIFYFQAKGGIARFNYSTCNYCSAKYLMAYSYENGGERPPTPDLVHVKGLYQVDFDEDEMWLLYKRYKV